MKATVKVITLCSLLYMLVYMLVALVTASWFVTFR